MIASSSPPTLHGSQPTPLFSELPEDVLILVLCYDPELRDLIAIRKTCRRLHAISYSELLWITLWHRLALRGVLPPLRPVEFIRPQRFAAEPTNGTTSPGPRRSKRSASKGPKNSARDCMQHVFEVQHRIHSLNGEQPAVAREVHIPILKRPLRDFVAISMTSGGEVLVVWTLSKLLVCDLRHKTSFKLSITREGDKPPQPSNFITTLYEYKGVTGVFIVGTFMRNSSISILFQAIPTPESMKRSPTPNYLVLSEFPIPSRDRICSMELSRQYLVVELLSRSPSQSSRYSRNVKVFDLQLDRSMVVSFSLMEYLQRAFISSDRLFVCYENGWVAEHELDLTDPTCITSTACQMHAHANTQTNHYFYDPVPRKNHRDDEPLHPEMRCWRFFPTQNNSHSMAMTLHLTAFKSEAPFPQIPAHPDSRFTLHTSESTAGRSHEQVILASVITSDADIPSTSDQDGTVEFQHALSVAGRSTLLSLLQVPALKQDLLLLSHSPTASRTTAESDQNWRTRYRPVHLRTQDGRPREIPTFGFGSTRKYLWNEHTGQIVVVTPEQSSCTMVRVYQI